MSLHEWEKFVYLEQRVHEITCPNSMLYLGLQLTQVQKFVTNEFGMASKRA